MTSEESADPTFQEMAKDVDRGGPGDMIGDVMLGVLLMGLAALMGVIYRVLR